jgi:hypothetical protein
MEAVVVVVAVAAEELISSLARQLLLEQKSEPNSKKPTATRAAKYLRRINELIYA